MHDATFLAEILSKRLIDEFIEILKIFLPRNLISLPCIQVT